MVSPEELIKVLPKAELHIHIEGALEPKLMFELAKENQVRIPYNSVEEIKKAYDFKNLQDFLNLYYHGMNVLQSEEDFYLLTKNYLRKAKENNVKYVEISFDPQAHLSRGLKFETVLEGILEALKEDTISWKIILSILRDRPVDEAMHTLSLAEPYLEVISILGLDSAEIGNPPSKFKEVFEKARELGLLTTAHAGEEGPPSYVREAVEILKVDRIDHGVRTMEDSNLLKELGKRRMTFTLCPLSNLKLHVVNNLRNYPLREIISAGIIATINSDDPAYFGGQVNENYLAIQEALGLSNEEIITLTKNSILGSFADPETKSSILKEIEEIEKTLE